MTSTAKKRWWSCSCCFFPFRRLEEEATCRICFQEFGRGGEAFKKDCCCKGDLALGHKTCIVNWFVYKGNSICDVCLQEVKNLPITLLKTDVRREAVEPRYQVHDGYLRRVWKALPLPTPSVRCILACVCFLEQLMVPDIGPTFSFVLPQPMAVGFVLLSHDIGLKWGLSNRYIYYGSILLPFLLSIYSLLAVLKH